MKSYNYVPHNKGIVVFIHGIIEGPKQFRNLARLANKKGYSSYCIVLPGHGGSGEAFADIDFRAWIKHVSQVLYELNQRYRELILVGHSMGALLALCEAASKRSCIKMVIAIDVPLRVHIAPRVLCGGYQILRGIQHKTHPYVLSEYRALGVTPISKSKFKYIFWLQRYIEFMSIMYYTRKRLSEVTVPVYAISAVKDEFVSDKSIYYLHNCKDYVGHLELGDSGHFCYHHNNLKLLENYFMIILQNEELEETYVE